MGTVSVGNEMKRDRAGYRRAGHGPPAADAAVPRSVARRFSEKRTVQPGDCGPDQECPLPVRDSLKNPSIAPRDCRKFRNLAPKRCCLTEVHRSVVPQPINRPGAALEEHRRNAVVGGAHGNHSVKTRDDLQLTPENLLVRREIVRV